MFERLTSEARALVVGAADQAGSLRHGWVGCEHLLLAIAGSATPTGQIFRDHGVTPETVTSTFTSVMGSGDGPGDDAVALAGLGIDLDEVRHAVEASFGPGALEAPVRSRRRGRRAALRRRRRSCTTPSHRQRFTPRAKRCLESSLREALSRKHRFVGVEHVALALLSRDDTLAWAVLLQLGAHPDELRRQVDDVLASTQQ